MLRRCSSLGIAAIAITGCGSAQQIPLPPSVRATLVRVAAADGGTQALTASVAERNAVAGYAKALCDAPSSLNMTAAGGAAVLRLLEHDHASSVYTETQSGFSWDSSSARVTHTHAKLSNDGKLTVIATFELSWHIHGARKTGASATSGAADSYAIAFARQPNATWQLTAIRHIGPPV